ncbi:hypothetical protein J3F83DRAFT_744341 [Trichoderma novae-zelandiae]
MKVRARSLLAAYSFSFYLPFPLSLLHPEGSWGIAESCIIFPLCGICYRRIAIWLERGRRMGRRC